MLRVRYIVEFTNFPKSSVLPLTVFSTCSTDMESIVKLFESNAIRYHQSRLFIESARIALSGKDETILEFTTALLKEVIRDDDARNKYYNDCACNPFQSPSTKEPSAE